jgi:hypothetical protein
LNTGAADPAAPSNSSIRVATAQALRSRDSRVVLATRGVI